MYYGRKSKSGPFIAGVLLILPFLAVLGGRLYTNITFDIHCGDRIKRAADANSIELAREEMEAVVTYAEEKGYTQGYTSVLWRTPSEDVGFWYTNLKTALDELKTVPTNTSPGDRANILKKLRETLLDHKQNGDTVTIPDGISRHPNNTLWYIGTLVTGLLACVGAIFLGVWFNRI
jgi:hypothetical protein